MNTPTVYIKEKTGLSKTWRMTKNIERRPLKRKLLLLALNEFTSAKNLKKSGIGYENNSKHRLSFSFAGRAKHGCKKGEKYQLFQQRLHIWHTISIAPSTFLSYQPSSWRKKGGFHIWLALHHDPRELELGFVHGVSVRVRLAPIDNRTVVVGALSRDATISGDLTSSGSVVISSPRTELDFTRAYAWKSLHLALSVASSKTTEGTFHSPPSSFSRTLLSTVGKRLQVDVRQKKSWTSV